MGSSVANLLPTPPIRFSGINTFSGWRQGIEIGGCSIGGLRLVRAIVFWLYCLYIAQKR